MLFIIPCTGWWSHIWNPAYSVHHPKTHNDLVFYFPWYSVCCIFNPSNMVPTLFQMVYSRQLSRYLYSFCAAKTVIRFKFQETQPATISKALAWITMSPAVWPTCLTAVATSDPGVSEIEDIEALGNVILPKKRLKLYFPSSSEAFQHLYWHFKAFTHFNWMIWWWCIATCCWIWTAFLTTNG